MSQDIAAGKPFVAHVMGALRDNEYQDIGAPADPAILYRVVFHSIIERDGMSVHAYAEYQNANPDWSRRLFATEE